MFTADKPPVLNSQFYSIVNLGTELNTEELKFKYREICKNYELYLRERTASNGRVAERTSSRLRRTNDRSVFKIISGDVEDAKCTSISYPSKQKYKLDSSSLHEDHEDDENAEIGVPLHAPNINLEISLSSEKLRSNLEPFIELYSQNPDLELIFASLYDENSFRLAVEIISLIPPRLDKRTFACTPLINSFILNYLNEQKKNLKPFIHLIPAVYNLKDLEYLKPFLSDLEAVKIFPCLAKTEAEILKALSHPIRDMENSLLIGENQIQLSQGTAQLSSSPLAKPHLLIGNKNKTDTNNSSKEEKSLSPQTDSRIEEIKSIIKESLSVKPNLKIICAGFGKVQLSEIKKFKEALALDLSPEFIGRIAIATRNNNFNEIKKFF